MGRPALDIEDVKLEVLTIRVQYSTLEDIRELSEQSGKKQSDIMREALRVGLAYAKSRRPSAQMAKPTPEWVC